MIDKNISEKAWQRLIIDTAQKCGWMCFHTYDSRKTTGKGFPDLVMVKDRVVWAELKTQRGRLTADQKRWRYALLAAGEEYHLWRPSDWRIVQIVLAN